MKRFLLAITLVFALCCNAYSISIWPGSGVRSYTDVVSKWTSCTSGYLKFDGTCEVPGGTGDVVGPGANNANYVPQWNGDNTKTLKNGFKLGTLTDTKWCVFTTAGGLACTTTAPQLELSLVKGTYADGRICTYTASGTVLDCNTATSTFQAALTNPVTGVASPTAGYLTKWGVSGNAIVDGPKLGTLTDTKWCNYTTANGLQCTSNAPQVDLTLLKGTLTNTYLCTYTSSGTLLDCNTNPATFQAALTYPVTGVASPTAGNLVKWGVSGNTLVDSIKFGTLTDARWCSYSTANGLACTETAPGATAVDDTAYNAGTWDGDTTHAPSKNAVRDYLESRIPTGSDGTYGLLTQNNTTRTPTASAYELYAEGAIWKLNQNGTEYIIPIIPTTAAQLTFTTGATTARTITFPDAAIFVARSDAANTFTGVQSFDNTTVKTYSSTSTATGNINIDGVSYADYNFSNGSTAATYTPVITSAPASGSVRYITLTVGGGSGVCTMTWTNVTFMGTAGAAATTTNKKSSYACKIPSSGNALCSIIGEAY